MFSPWARKIPWRRKWQPTPVFLSENSRRQRSLVGYSPWGHKESGMKEQLSVRAHTHTHTHTQNPSPIIDNLIDKLGVSQKFMEY